MATKSVSRGRDMLSSPIFRFQISRKPTKVHPPPRQALSLTYHNIRFLIWTVSPFIISEYIKNQKINNPFLPESLNWPQNSHSQAN